MPGQCLPHVVLHPFAEVLLLEELVLGIHNQSTLVTVNIHLTLFPLGHLLAPLCTDATLDSLYVHG